MFTPLLTVKPYVQSIRPGSRVVLSPRSLGWLKETQHRVRTLALFFVLSIMVVPVLACASPSTVSPLERRAAPAVGGIPLRLHSGQELGLDRLSIKLGISRVGDPEASGDEGHPGASYRATGQANRRVLGERL